MARLFTSSHGNPTCTHRARFPPMSGVTVDFKNGRTIEEGLDIIKEKRDLVYGYRMLIVMLGSNDLSHRGKKPAEVVVDLQAAYWKLRSRRADLEVRVCTLFNRPRLGTWYADRQTLANDLLEGAMTFGGVRGDLCSYHRSIQDKLAFFFFPPFI